MTDNVTRIPTGADYWLSVCRAELAAAKRKAEQDESRATDHREDENA